VGGDAGCMCCYNHHFVALCLGLPGWAGTRRNIHTLTPILIINYPLSASPSTTIHSLFLVQFMCLTMFLHNLSTTSLGLEYHIHQLWKSHGILIFTSSQWGCEILCDELVCVSVHSHNSKTARPNFTEFLMHVALARSSFDGIAVRYLLPVLWMTSCFHNMGPMGRINHGIMFRKSSPEGSTSWTSIQLLC